MRGGAYISGLILFAAMPAVPAAAAPASATVTAVVKAKVVKPLALTALQDLDLGTIVLANGSWSGATVSISQSGVLGCTSVNLVCTGSAQPARYRLVGTNRETIQVSAPNVTLVNQADSSKTLQMVLSAPATLVLPNSGNQGITFAVGGSIALDSTTAGGLYAGTLNVTVDYQ